MHRSNQTLSGLRSKNLDRADSSSDANLDCMLDPQLFEMTSIAIRRNPIYSLVSRQLKLASTPVPRSCTSSRSFASTAMADAQTAMFLNEKILAKAMTGDLEKVEGKWVLSPSSVSYVRPWHQRDS